MYDMSIGDFSNALYVHPVDGKYEGISFNFCQYTDTIALHISQDALSIRAVLTADESDTLLRGLARHFGYDVPKPRKNEESWINAVELDFDGKYLWGRDLGGLVEGVEIWFHWDDSGYPYSPGVALGGQMVLTDEEAGMLLEWLAPRAGWDLSPPFKSGKKVPPIPPKLNVKTRRRKG